MPDMTCTCKFRRDGKPCTMKITQEDLLCDFCAGRKSLGSIALSCEVVSTLTDDKLVSAVDHDRSAKET